MEQWLREAVFYQIYPQTFQDSNADGIGDLPGILTRLDYIEALGCNAIWLNPVFQSPFMDAGYDISDYLQVAPRYGTNSDLKKLFGEVHKRGMHIILDLVPGHTSVEHPWFRESLKGALNRYTRRYIWTDDISQSFSLRAPDSDDGENIRSFLMGIGERDGLCATNYYSCQPCLNYGFEQITGSYQSRTDSPEALDTLEEMMQVMRFWLQMGCDGFRVDMAGSLVKSDPEGKGNIRLWQKVRAFLDQEYPDAVLISEWGRPEYSLAAGFHMDFLLHCGKSHYMDLFRTETPYFCRDGRGDISRFLKLYEKNYELTAGKGLICIPSGNHDISRMAGKLDEEERKIAFAFVMAMPGVPFIYNGDEIGMHQIDGLISKEGSRSIRAGARTPMQWNTGLNAGFSDAPPEKLYLPLDESADRPCAAREMEREDSLWREIQRLIALRRRTPELCADASVEFLFYKEGAQPVVFCRRSAEKAVLAAINPFPETKRITIRPVRLGTCIYEQNGQAAADEIPQGETEKMALTIPGCSASYFKIII